ncbi:unnamed protein product, partial [Prorocentrum cordatum]
EPMSSMTVQRAFFTMRDMVRYAIVDSGATRSMSGVNLVGYLQEQVLLALGSDEIKYHESEPGDCLRFALVPTSSPTLLGLDYLKAAAADITHDGLLVYSDSHRE